MLHVLTATGARPAAFSLCVRWMARQTYAGRVTWIIVDDGPEPAAIPVMPANWHVVLIRPAPFWQPGQNTQRRNLAKGLAAVQPGGRLVIVEDDDWYAADWLATVAAELERAELVGENDSRYFNVATGRGKAMHNTKHASLCATAMRGAALETFRQVLRTCERGIDMQLWNRHPSRHLFTGHRVVGIKGLPGREGIGVGHRPAFGEDANLRQWIGDDAEAYAK